MKFTKDQVERYLRGELRIVTNPHTKRSHLVACKPPRGCATSQTQRAYYKLRRLSRLDDARAQKRDYMRSRRLVKRLTGGAAAATPAATQLEQPTAPERHGRGSPGLTAEERAARMAPTPRRAWGSVKTKAQVREARNEYRRRYRAKHYEKYLAARRRRREAKKLQAMVDQGRRLKFSHVPKLDHQSQKRRKPGLLKRVLGWFSPAGVLDA